MKKFLLIILLSVVCCLLSINFSFANGWTPACDPCGFCVGGEKPTNWDNCMDCIQKEGYAWTVLGCIPSGPGGFIQIVLQTAVRVIGGITFLAFLYGGFTLLTSSGDVKKITKGKTIVMSSIIGLLFIIFSVFILKLVGYEILKIPGFGP